MLFQSKNLDEDRLKADRAAGLSNREIGKKHGVSDSTIRRHLNGANGAHPAKRGQPRANGHRVSDSGDGLAELSAFLDHHWKRLPLAAKVRLLVDQAVPQ